MKPDPVIDAVRAARHRISESVGHDLGRLVEHYKRLQERHRDRLVQPPVKPKSDEEAA